MKKLIGFITIILLTSSCQSAKNLFTSEDEVITGERISVIDSANNIEIDKDLAQKPVTIMAEKNIISWYKTDGMQAKINGNLKFVGSLKAMQKISVSGGNNLDTNYVASPVVDNNTLFTVNDSAVVYAFDLKTNKKIWEAKLDKLAKKNTGFNSSLVISDGRLFVVSGSNKIFALDAKNGQVLWQRQLNSIARATPEIAKDVLYVLTVDNKLYALDAKTGVIKWMNEGATEEVSVMGGASPLIVGDKIVVSYSSGDIAILNSTNSDVINDISLSSDSGANSYNFDDVDASPIASDKVVYALSSDGVFLAFATDSGETIWNQPIAGSKTPWIMGDFIYLISQDRELLCLSKDTGAVKWKTSLPKYKNAKKKKDDIYWSGPIVAGGNLILTNSRGQVTKIDAKSGKILEDVEIGGVLSQPIVVDGKLIIRRDNGVIYIIGE